MSSNVSADVIFDITRNTNAYLVKRTYGGAAQFSRDPLNLVSVNSRKYAGFASEKAVGIAPAEKGGVQVTTKKAGSFNKPASSRYTVTYGGNKTTRKTYKSIASQVAKSGYAPRLRQAAVARASALRAGQRPVKPDQEKKLRGNAAKRAEAN